MSRFPHRDDDTFGMGMGYANVSSHAAAFGPGYGASTQAPFIRSQRRNLHRSTYQYQVTPWWQLQPDFQYVFNPGAGVANPNIPGSGSKNEASSASAPTFCSEGSSRLCLPSKPIVMIFTAALRRDESWRETVAASALVLLAVPAIAGSARRKRANRKVFWKPSIGTPP